MGGININFPNFVSYTLRSGDTSQIQMLEHISAANCWVEFPVGDLCCHGYIHTQTHTSKPDNHTSFHLLLRHLDLFICHFQHEQFNTLHFPALRRSLSCPKQSASAFQAISALPVNHRWPGSVICHRFNMRSRQGTELSLACDS